jgi:hypothetical protein
MKVVAVYYAIESNTVSTVCGQNAELLDAKASVTLSIKCSRISKYLT